MFGGYSGYYSFMLYWQKFNEYSTWDWLATSAGIRVLAYF